MRTMQTRRRSGARHRMRFGIGLALIACLVALAACQAGPGAPSSLKAGYVYYDFPIKNQTVQNWTSGATSAVVKTSAANSGQLVYVETICSGTSVALGSTYVIKVDSVDAAGTVNNVGAPSVQNCTFREHIPKGWPVPTIVVGATHGPGGAVTSVGAIISNY